ncbi:ROK family transcriptional regulator [Nonomuraea jiangxiensis]|uniref:Sugar kinase of the NBD/HSP70 family, may contain an N-terminal HTH domain n=1 Tax=Nonomuraea jiangxiensis TaxID=633440 RepID=A0A1G8INA8_9ACTN|nr:ROK family transcriptional regulator [Nonomuraea jiangxiensis]SDI20332.1 Sugar kinase of the NBD/HSP70 family, may contain an N-terminal HTH domain [Nonomuraea jiangxiensis]
MRGELGNPRLLRVMNERRLLDRLQEHGPASRADLAKVTGLSKPTVSAALAGLAKDGLVHLVGEVSGRPGPVTSLYDMNAGSAHVAGIDIGRDWNRVVVADLRGSFVGREDGRNDASTTADLAAHVRELAHAAAAAAGLEWSAVTCAVAGTPGVYDPVAGRLDFAGNVPGADLVEQLRSALDPDLVIENDINLAAVGEHAYGEGRGKTHFALVSVGTGVGMGIVVNGELYVGARGAAGEVSYLPTAEDPAGDPAALEHGSTEALASAPGVVRAARAAGLDLGSAKEVFEAAGRGDRTALAVVEAEGQRIGGLLVTVWAVLDPEVIVLSGGVGRNLDLLGGAIERRITELGPLRPRVVASALGDSGVLLGAVARARKRAWDLIFQSRLG